MKEEHIKEEKIKWIASILGTTVSGIGTAVLSIMLFFSFHIKDNMINTFRLQSEYFEKKAIQDIKFWQDRYEAYKAEIQPHMDVLKAHIDILEKEIDALNDKNITLAKQLDRLKNTPSVVNNKEASTAVADIVQSSQKISEQSGKVVTGISNAKADLEKIHYLTIEGNKLLIERQKTILRE